jgi:hypothetical protein
MPQARLLEALKLLANSGADYVIVGGVAANLHGLSRATKDIDILIPKDLENTEKILNALGGLTWGIAREIPAEEVISKPFTIIGDMPRIDILLSAGKLNHKEASKNKEVRVIEGIKVSFASLEDLIRSKQTGRPNDEITIAELKKLKKIN